MELKNVTVFGFKTFAELTSLDFATGITAIVGPNGSGKSNLVDAIRWALGEQSSKSLRSGKTEDVIFAGNDKRKPLGMTEVSLTFDNSDRRLPVDYAEVQVTRRAYRAGETEYYINRNHVRLRDVMDVLVGTGLGSGSYAIVSQGEIDAVLRSRPSERRTLFEETAGLNRFLARKSEAMRRLEQTETNAIRINDLIAELQRLIPELDSQVRRAKRYRKVSARLREMEILSYVRASTSRRQERQRINVLTESNQQRRDGAAAETARLSEELSQLRYAAYQRELRLEEERGAAGDGHSRAARLEAEFAATLTQLKALESQDRAHAADASRIAAERSAGEKTIVGLEARLSPLQQELERARAAEAQAQSRLRQERAEVEALFTALREAEAAAAEEQARKAALSVQSEHARVAADRFEEEARTLRAQAEQSELAVQRGTRQYRETELELQRLQTQLAELRARGDESEAACSRATGELAQCERQYRDYCGELASAESRLNTLEELEASLEGHVPGTRAVMEAFARGELVGVEGIVSNVIQVEERYARALDVAFGGRLSDIIMTSSGDARRALDYLTSNELGRATFLPLDALRARSGHDIGDLAGRAGVVGYAHTLIRTRSELTGVIAFLVGKVLVVDELQTGIALVDATGLRDTVVSLSGEIIFGGGALSGGRSQKERSLLSRRLQAQALAQKLPAMMNRQRELEGAVQSARECVQRTILRREQAKQEANHVEIRLAEMRAGMTNALADIERSKRDCALASRRVAELAEQVTDLRRQRDEYTPTPAAGNDEERLGLEAALVQARERIVQTEELLATSSASAGNVREALAAVVAECEGARARLQLLNAESERVGEGRDVVRAQIIELRERSDACGQELARLRERVELADAQIADSRAERDRANAQIAELENKVRDSQLQEREAEAEGERDRTRLAQIEAELGMLVENFAQNPATQAECDDVEARYATDPADAASELPRLREDLSRLSSVNLHAEADREELAARETFLREQMQDLAKARETLLQVIADIDAATQEQFNATFNAVSAAFAEMFVRIFPGGEARMWQTNPDELAETGIEIAVQPPGKKMMPLAALSGGERAMTAAALIFALIRVRPSPFYLLDEVDAALDEANVERFSDMVRELAAGAQMLIVTHNKKTMELADRMYGVTMSEPGVSSVMSTALSAKRSPEPAFA